MNRDQLLSEIINQLIAADQLAAQYAELTGIRLGPYFKPEQFAGPADPVDEQPIYDAEGVSQPMGRYGLVMLKAVEDKREDIRAVSPAHAEPDKLAVLYACAPGLKKLAPGSDQHWMVSTEISWASFGAFGVNPFEADLFNVFEILPADAVKLPHERLKRKYQEYVPGARALPDALKTGKACAALVLEQIRAKMDNDRIPDTDAIDFSPARPRR